jgi:dipeptidase E
MWTDVKGKTMEDLNQFSAVYISGGNTLSLLNDFKEAFIDKMLLQYYKNGGTIYGQSAGAIIFGNCVSHTCSKGDEYNAYKGLNLIKNYSLWCHYSAKDDIAIKDYLMKSEKQFILRPEGSAALVNEKNILGIGERKPMIGKLDRFGEISKQIISY